VHLADPVVYGERRRLNELAASPALLEALGLQFAAVAAGLLSPRPTPAGQ
jgi:hypothetical protein